MKIKFLIALFLGCTLNLSAQAYLDGIEYYKADQYANARAILERTINDADTDKAIAYYYLGQLYIKYQEYDKALEHFNKGIEANPNYGYNYVGLAALELKNGNKKEAENHIKTAKKFGKKDAQLLVDIARAYYDADKEAYRKNIDKTLKDAYKANPEEPSYYLFIGDTVIVKATNNRELGDAAAFYDLAINFAPNSAYTVVKYSSLYEKLNPEYAITRMKEYLANNPNSALAQRELAERLYNQKLYEEAAIEYGKYIKMPGHFTEDEERYAILLYSSKKYAEAYEIAKVAAPKAYNPFFMDRMLFYTKLELKDFAEAYDYANEYFKKYPDPKYHSDNDYIKYAQIAFELAKVDTINAKALTDSAITKYDALIKKNPKNQYPYNALANYYSKQKDYLNAIKYSKALIDASESPKGEDYEKLAYHYVNQAFIESDATKVQELKDSATITINKALELSSTSPYIARSAGVISYSINGKYTPEFEKHYLKALELFDANKEYYKKTAANVYSNIIYTLGIYYYNNKETAKAKEMFIRYQEFDPQNAQVIELLNSIK